MAGGAQLDRLQRWIAYCFMIISLGLNIFRRKPFWPMPSFSASTLGLNMTDSTILDILRAQEQGLMFTGFNEEIAFALGSALRARAAAAQVPVVIEIRNASRRFYFSALPGSTPENDNWARRKANTVLQCHVSSLLMGKKLAFEGRSQWPDAVLELKDYSVHGGAFPVRLKEGGVVAVIAVSREDHELIVSVLKEFLGAEHVPVTP